MRDATAPSGEAWAAPEFENRHVGPSPDDVQVMLERLGLRSLDELVAHVIPAGIRLQRPLRLPAARSEREVLAELEALASRNQVQRSFIGMGYYDCITPPVIRRAILDNPGWYTAYTPYQSEISQGRLEALLNFQTMVADLTGFEIANASLLDEGTAAAEAMMLCHRVQPRGPSRRAFFVSELCHPQTVEVVRTRAGPLGIDVVVGDHDGFEFSDSVFGALVQYPATDGRLVDYEPVCARARSVGARVVVATDLLALTLLRAPGEFGADVAVGNSQRFGVPLGYGGPHAAFLATRDEVKRQLPGRLIGVSRDADGRMALRMALQTREQHIRRDKATSNICTAQVLLAVVAAMYAVYHGPRGLRQIAERVHLHARLTAGLLARLGRSVAHEAFFDTLRVGLAPDERREVVRRAAQRRINLREFRGGDVGISFGETVGLGDVRDLVEVLGARIDPDSVGRAAEVVHPGIPSRLQRRSDYLSHPVFNTYHSETEFLRYAHRLETRDLSLNASMIPLGSCTMKLNAAAEMVPIGLAGFAELHPFVPAHQAAGYRALFARLVGWLREITGFAGVSLMPNSGAQGEYAGLLVIRAYHASRGEPHRRVCLIPESAHGTNPASAAMAGMDVVVVACDAAGNIDLGDLERKARTHADRLGALMVTYPSTHGVFEESIRDVCATVHRYGGQVYLDGANFNALIGLCRPSDLGADVCHLNLHKTFCIPHGGGGPGVGPICVAEQLVPYLPRHPLAAVGGERGIGPVASAPFGSAGVLPIAYAYIALMGSRGLTRASQVALLNANYVARRLEGHYELLYRGPGGWVAHECIIDPRPLRATADVTVEDIAKRLIDYGFHAPTMSWPVAGTLMVEPTESESKAELDRFCDAMIAIREEIREIEDGRANRENNLLRNAPHTAWAIASASWDRPYSRERAAFPAPWSREFKLWPAAARVDNAYGDRHVMCTCPPVEAYVGSLAGSAEPAGPGRG
jgi:glycine dehydrogenase